MLTICADFYVIRKKNVEKKDEIYLKWFIPLCYKNYNNESNHSSVNAAARLEI
jgi:hypothetical protein